MILTRHDIATLNGIQKSSSMKGVELETTAKRAKEAGLNPATVKSRVHAIRARESLISYADALDQAIEMGASKRPRKH